MFLLLINFHINRIRERMMKSNGDTAPYGTCECVYHGFPLQQMGVERDGFNLKVSHPVSSERYDKSN